MKEQQATEAEKIKAVRDQYDYFLSADYGGWMGDVAKIVTGKLREDIECWTYQLRIYDEQLEAFNWDWFNRQGIDLAERVMKEHGVTVVYERALEDPLFNIQPFYDVTKKHFFGTNE